MSVGEFDEFDTTPEQFDAYMAAGEPARLVDGPVNLSGIRVATSRGITASGNRFEPATSQP